MSLIRVDEFKCCEIEIRTLADYLASTDWYVVRYADEGTAIPEGIKEMRADARRRISELREIINPHKESL